MATRELLSPSQRIRLDELPVDLDERLMARHHTFSDEELAAVHRRRSPANRLGYSAQLALLKFPGRAPRSGERAPEKIVRYVASQIGDDPTAIDDYARGRDIIRREHLAESFAPRIRNIKDVNLYTIEAASRYPTWPPSRRQGQCKGHPL